MSSETLTDKAVVIVLPVNDYKTTGDKYRRQKSGEVIEDSVNVKDLMFYEVPD
jgi:hypothetical protein